MSKPADQSTGPRTVEGKALAARGFERNHRGRYAEGEDEWLTMNAA